MFYGLDLHSNNAKVTVLNEKETIPITLRFSLEPRYIQKFIDGLSKNDYIAVEASTNTFWFCDLVASKVKQCFVIDPYQFSIIRNSMVKTDKRDAVHLVNFLKGTTTFQTSRRNSG